MRLCVETKDVRCELTTSSAWFEAAATMNGGYVVWFTGMPGSGKTTSSRLLEQRLRACGTIVETLDGDDVRRGVSLGLGFTREDREENIKRIGRRSQLLCREDVAVIVAAISPYREARDRLRVQLPNFIEVYMECPIEMLISYDVKGLYKRALAGELKNFTGVSDPYEPPLKPEVTIHTYRETVEEGVAKILKKLRGPGPFEAQV